MIISKDAEQLVKDSFLADEEKAFLIKILETEGPTNNFFNKFKDFIVGEFKNIAEKYKTAVLDLNSDFEQADKWFSDQKEVLEKETQDRLEQIKPTDVKGKNEFWKTYDKKFADISKEYKERLDKATSRTILSNIK
jgi:hypothetical protein